MPYTPTSELELMFDPELIPQGAIDALEARNLALRPLCRTDYDRGHLDVLRDLTETIDMGKEGWTEQFDRMRNAQPQAYYIIVIVDKDTDRLVATGSLITEIKFIRNRGICGHIEEISVSKQQQGKKLGYYIVTALTEIGERVGCYKSILDCSEANRGFYEKCGHVLKGIQMAKYASKKEQDAE